MMRIPLVLAWAGLLVAGCSDQAGEAPAVAASDDPLLAEAQELCEPILAAPVLPESVALGWSDAAPIAHAKPRLRRTSDGACSHGDAGAATC